MNEYRQQSIQEYLEAYLKNPGRFTILILGERGVGKTHRVKESIKEDKPLVHLSCASFEDDNTAESELFGVKKGVFTGVDERTGAFADAKEGYLFLDEVHQLSKRVQAKLMTVLQTESKGSHKGKFGYSKLGENKKQYSNARVIFATNQPVNELRTQYLLPDFYDRIAQLVVEIPPLRKTSHIEQEFEKIWKHMAFKEHSKMPGVAGLSDWLSELPLAGNYRDLEKIAILWHQKRLMGETNEAQILKWVKDQMENYHGKITLEPHNVPYFEKGKTKEEMIKQFRNAMYDWATRAYSTKKEAEKELGISRLDILKE